MSNIDTSSWKEFRIGDLFEVCTTKSIDKNKLIPNEAGKYNFIGRTTINNGIQCKVDEQDYLPNEENVFSVIQIGQTSALWQDTKWYGSQNLFKLIPLYKEIATTHIFFQTAINKVLSAKYGNEYNSYPTKAELSNLTVFLPVTTTEEPDYEYMEKYIAELEAERVAELEAYLSVSGLDDYELTEEDIRVLSLSRSGSEQNAALAAGQQIGTVKYQKFRYIDFFELLPVKNKRNKLDIQKDGTTALMSADTTNNGIIGKIKIDAEFKVCDACPFYIVFGDHTRTMNIVDYNFCAADNVKVLKPFIYNRYVNQYICTVWQKSILKLGYARHWSIAKNSEIWLPIADDGSPDYAYMESYIRAQEKLAIKNAVLLKDRIIEETRKIAG